MRKQSETQKKSEEGFQQAKLYSYGALGGIELRYYRYIILVSQDYLSNMPSDKDIDCIRYRFINIAVNPSRPSDASKKLAMSI